jgi:hypothetical protein
MRNVLEDEVSVCLSVRDHASDLSLNQRQEKDQGQERSRIFLVPQRNYLKQRL